MSVSILYRWTGFVVFALFCVVVCVCVFVSLLLCFVCFFFFTASGMRTDGKIWTLGSSNFFWPLGNFLGTCFYSWRLCNSFITHAFFLFSVAPDLLVWKSVQELFKSTKKWKVPCTSPQWMDQSSIPWMGWEQFTSSTNYTIKWLKYSGSTSAVKYKKNRRQYSLDKI